MCKSNYKPKYQSYSIKITYLNGDTEDINYKGINTSNYKDMLKLYKDVKEQYKKESVTINFLGKTADGQLNIMFQKKIVNKDAENKEYAEKVINTEVEDIFQQIINNIKILNDKFKNSKNYQGILDKEINIKIHDIQNVGKNVADSFKIKIYDEISDLENKRRFIKNNFQTIHSLKQKLQTKGLSLEKIQNMFQSKLNSIEKNKNKDYEILTDEKTEELKIMKKASYKNFKDRVNKIKELSKDYDKVYYDNSKMEIICYNKAKIV